MFRIIFIAVGGGEREVIIPAETEAVAMSIAVKRDDFGLVLTCTELDSLEDWAVQDRRLRHRRMAA